MSNKDKTNREGAVVSDPNQPGVSSGKTVKEAEENGAPGGITAKNDDSYKQHFPQAAAAGGAREDYQRTADARRIQAERAANQERARQAKVNEQPEPSGEGDNPHEGESPAEVEKHGGDKDQNQQ